MSSAFAIAKLRVTRFRLNEAGLRRVPPDRGAPAATGEVLGFLVATGAGFHVRSIHDNGLVAVSNWHFLVAEISKAT
jgi:hypothetical protein